MTGGTDVANHVAGPVLRKGVIREAARASDSYGLVLVLVAAGYLVLSVGWTNGTPIVLAAALTGITALLAFIRLMCGAIS